MTNEKAIKWMEEAIQETTECFEQCSPSLQKELVMQKEAFELAITALRSMPETTKPGWISVKERLPNEEDDVLILVREIEHYGRHHEKREVYYWQFVGWRVDEKWATTYCHGFRYIDDENKKEPRCEHEVTHWMPLPEPPEEG